MQEIMLKLPVKSITGWFMQQLAIRFSMIRMFRMVKLYLRPVDLPNFQEFSTGRPDRNSTSKSEETPIMAAIFPSEEWLAGLEEKLNSDTRYQEVAKNWEGDLFFFIEPEGTLKERLTFYLDLWHGTCRKAEYKPSPESHPNPTFTLTATYKDITSVLTGKLNPMTAMMTSKLKVKGSLGYMMRNVPTVLDFVRVAQESTSEVL
jgi:putative sterol carrier protein